MTIRAPKTDTALLMIDVQKQFCDPLYERGTPQTVAMAGHINRLVPHFRRAGVAVYPVYYAKYPATYPTYVDFFRFKPRPQDTVTMKTHDSAFKDTGLADILQTAQHKNILICGFNLNACVKRTALDAAALGYDTAVLLDMSGNDLWNARDSRYAREELRAAGIKLLQSWRILPVLRGMPISPPNA